jgi:tetratricopeptide (TPR) repeat protein
MKPNGFEEVAGRERWRAMLELVSGPGWSQQRPSKVVVRLGHEAGRLIDEGNALAALERCDRAIRLCPDDPVLHCLRACALDCLDRYDEAIKACRKAIRLNKDYGETYFYLDWALFGKGRPYIEILNAFDRAAELGSSHPLLHPIRGLCLRSLGRHAEAVEAYSLALADLCEEAFFDIEP